MQKISISVDIMEHKLQRAVSIGERPYKEVMGTDLEKEYHDILHNIGYYVMAQYKNNAGRTGR